MIWSGRWNDWKQDIGRIGSIMKDRLMGDAHICIHPLLNSRIWIAVPERKVAAGEMRSNPMTG
jgi:hypothetical protein